MLVTRSQLVDVKKRNDHGNCFEEIIAAVGNLQPSAHHSLGLSVLGCGSCASVSAAWGGRQHHPWIILTFRTFLILFWGGQQYHLLILFPIHFILFVVLYFLRPPTSSFFSISTFWSFLEEAGNIFFYPIWCPPLFLGLQHPPLIILTFVFLLKEAENFLLSFLFLDIFVEVNQIHFLLSLTFFRPITSPHLIPFSCLKDPFVFLNSLRPTQSPFDLLDFF